MGKRPPKGNPVLLGCKSSIFYTNQSREVQLESVNKFNISSNNILENNNQTNYCRPPREDLTVCVQNVSKSYEKGKPVLSNLCMNVRKGTIYGLLGSSGCGKTTLLSCIVGLKKWDAGEILVFNKRPNGTSANRIGFMPQDISLHDQISIRETIEYYGRLYGMTKSEVDKQWVWLVDFLQLPAKFTLIKDLSGGQKRRVSLAITFVHSPECLFLDEPTVGLDPLLRESIWDHLLKMVQVRKTTVIVTTHYIEEARYSNTIGVMRKGRLLVEDSPEALLQQYECDLLEQVVLKLCHKDEQVLKNSIKSGSNNSSKMSEVVIHDKKKLKSGSDSSKNSYNVYEKFQENWRLSHQRRSSIKMSRGDGKQEASESSIFNRIHAMSSVLWIIFMRHPVFLSLVLFLPTFQIIITLAVLGTHPKDLKFGIVNHDNVPSFDFCFNDYESNNVSNMESSISTKSCNFEHLSCSLIEELARSGTLTLTPVQSAELAREQVIAGDLWGYFLFPNNYSQYVANLVTEHKFAGNKTFDGSRVHLTMDMSNYLGAAMAIKDAYQSYENFAYRLARSCGLDPREFQIPMMYREPVFGQNSATYQEYVIPVIILSVLFEVPMMVTSIIYISDRKQGILDRSRVAGLCFKEVMMSHFLTQGSVIIGQTAIVSVVLHFLYNFRVQGSYCIYFFLCLLCGLCGEAVGMLIGVIFKDEVGSLMFGIFLGPILLLYEGAVWPLEGMSSVVRNIAYASPTTLIVESLRGVIYKGVGIQHGDVWPGIGTMVAWTLGCWILSIIFFMKFHK